MGFEMWTIWGSLSKSISFKENIFFYRYYMKRWFFYENQIYPFKNEKNVTRKINYDKIDFIG